MRPKTGICWRSALPARSLPLLTGGSGIALGLPENFRRRGLLQTAADAEAMPEVGGTAAVLAGSCSAATLGQIEAFAKIPSRAEARSPGNCRRRERRRPRRWPGRSRGSRRALC